MGSTLKAQLQITPISAIQTEPRIQNGIPYKIRKVCTFLEFLRTGWECPPIRVWWDGETNWLSDGLHRLTATEQHGCSHIVCEIHAGTCKDALWDSYSATGARLALLPLAEIAHFVSSALRHPIAATLSDAKLAEHLRVANSFVRHWRRRCSNISPATFTGGDVTDRIVIEAINCMRENLGSAHDISKLAKQVGVSQSHLSRRFRQATKSSPGVVFAEIRMELARELLTLCGLSIKEIASQLAYKRSDEFSRAFLQVYGVSPRSWRHGNLTEAAGRQSNLAALMDSVTYL